jgi:hypothetical protein
MTFLYVRIGLRGACGGNMPGFQDRASNLPHFFRALDFVPGCGKLAAVPPRLATC